MDDQSIKKDAGKNKLDLVPASWFIKDGEVLTFGIQKGYEANSWRKVDINKFKAATLRHLFAYLNGEKLDPESGLEHLAHVRTNIGFLMELDKENK